MSAQFNLAAVSALAAAAARHVFDADAKHAAAMQKAVADVVDALRPLSGASTQEAVSAWSDVAQAFKAAYVARAEVKGSTDAKGAADQAWSRMVRAAGLERPQTPEQKRAAEKKKAQREADRADKGAAPTVEEKAAKDLAAHEIVLTAAEFHLLALIRAGKFAAATTMLASMATTKPEAIKAPAAPAVPKTKAPKTKAAPVAEAAPM